ncbi:lipid droplet assembly factor 1 [Notamacropus eugenii]|uniref:lipid droplet assembly factor 1 n=1 Tax=Notamacropus eugenii TaxID=9315 RepID=UPI003B67E4B6
MVKMEASSISRDLQELQKMLTSLITFIQSNSEVIAFMNSPVGRYLDKHPFVALTLLMFIVESAIPVGLFLLLVVLMSLAACVGVILVEGLIISLGGLTLFFVLCGLGFLSLAMSGIISMCYMVLSTLINYWFSFGSPKHQQSLGNKCPKTVQYPDSTRND